MKKLLIFLMALLLVGCTEVTTPVKQPPTGAPGKEMLVHFIDVGQGDSILVQSPNGKTMLIDGGVKGAGKDVVAYLRGMGVSQLDYVVATHPDADHIGGLITVLNSISIKNFVDSGKVHTSQTFEEMLMLVNDKNIPYTVPEIGDTLPLDEALKIEVLAADEHASDNNEASIVLRIAYNDISFLLTGDAGISGEKEMIARGDVQATILKAGHHGSNTSSSPSFIEAVHPQAAILSYGQDNKYGHPHVEVIESLQRVGSDIYGTAEVGTIIVKTDGTTFEVNGSTWTGDGTDIDTSAASTAPVVSKADKIELASKDVQAEIVAIQNNSDADVSLAGWQLISVEGDQVYNFPEITLKAGKVIYVTSGPDAKAGTNYLEWTKKQIWLNTGDPAQLKNAKGEIVSELE
ncbi:MAG: MBL fold metallo-hydrolase [Solibacillus sp.]